MANKIYKGKPGQENVIPGEHQINGTRLTANITGTFNFDWNANTYYVLTPMSATVLGNDNLPTGTNSKEIKGIIKAGAAVTLPANWVATADSDAFDNTKDNHFRAWVSAENVVTFTNKNKVVGIREVSNLQELAAIPKDEIGHFERVFVRGSNSDYFYNSTKNWGAPYEVAPNDQVDGIGWWLRSPANLLTTLVKTGAHIPADTAPYGVSSSFYNNVQGLLNASSIDVKGHSTTSMMWQLIGQQGLVAQDTADSIAQEWYLRYGRGNTWGTKHRIWHSGNFNPSEAGGGATITNITQIANRSYNDLQDLPKELKAIEYIFDNTTYSVKNSDKNKILVFAGSPTISIPENEFANEDVIIKCFSETVVSFNSGGSAGLMSLTGSADKANKAVGSFELWIRGGTGSANGGAEYTGTGVISLYTIKEAPNGTLYKIGVSNTGTQTITPL